jgi:uncharacterized linocin/CFP29 family protein
MDLLKRDLAPILPQAWDLIDREARRVLAFRLAGRKIVDFDGPHGWLLAAVNTGRLKSIDEQPVAGVEVGLRVVVPLVELRTTIRLDLRELEDVGRGAPDPDLRAVVQAAENFASAEDRAIFNGFAAAGIRGIATASPHTPLDVSATTDWPLAVASAKERLRASGVDGPYSLVLGPKPYGELTAGGDDGYPLSKRIERQIIDGPLVWAPAIEGALLVSVRGGDFQLTVGEDISIGYARHDRDTVDLFLIESFTFRLLEPMAAIAFRRK